MRLISSSVTVAVSSVSLQFGNVIILLNVKIAPMKPTVMNVRVTSSSVYILRSVLMLHYNVMEEQIVRMRPMKSTAVKEMIVIA